MLRLKILPKKDYRRATWKNGLGYTDEIAIHPEGAELRKGDFLWRLSSARIEQASPFSMFPEHDRHLVVLQGNGFRLTHTFEESAEEEVAEIPALEPYEFPGDVPSRCELLSGPITDLSVFVRKAEAEAVVEVQEVEAGDEFHWLPAGRWNFAFAARGSFEVDSQRVSQGDSIRVELDAPLDEGDSIRIQGGEQGGVLVLVGLQG